METVHSQTSLAANFPSSSACISLHFWRNYLEIIAKNTKFRAVFLHSRPPPLDYCPWRCCLPTNHVSSYVCCNVNALTFDIQAINYAHQLWKMESLRMGNFSFFHFHFNIHWCAPSFTRPSLDIFNHMAVENYVDENCFSRNPLRMHFTPIHILIDQSSSKPPLLISLK